MRANPAFDELLVRNQVQARAVAAKYYPFKCRPAVGHSHDGAR
jgi:hypothetical protein